MGSHSVTCYPTQVNTPRFNPSHTGRYSIYLPRRDGRLSWPSHRFWYESKVRMRRPVNPSWSYVAPFQRYCRFFCTWLHPYSTLILGVFPLEQTAHVGASQWVSPSRNRKLISREIIFEVFQAMWSHHLKVTDGQTQTDIRRTVA